MYSNNLVDFISIYLKILGQFDDGLQPYVYSNFLLPTRPKQFFVCVFSFYFNPAIIFKLDKRDCKTKIVFFYEISIIILPVQLNSIASTALCVLSTYSDRQK